MQLLAPLHHTPTAYVVSAERALNRRLEGGCQVPIGAFGILQGDELWLRGLVASPDGSALIQDDIRGAKADAEALGVALAERLLSAGADKILQNVYGH